MTKKRRKMRGTVQKVIKPVFPGESEKAEIEVHEADDLYREIRVENVLTDDQGNKGRLQPGEKVDVTVEAEIHRKEKKPKST
jgi:acyl dehydratase